MKPGIWRFKRRRSVPESQRKLKVGDIVHLNADGRKHRYPQLKKWEGFVEGFKYFPAFDSKGYRGVGQTWVQVDWGKRHWRNRSVRCFWLEHPDDLVAV